LGRTIRISSPSGSNTIMARAHWRGFSLSPSASPKSDLEFHQPFLDMVAFIQGKVANTRQKPANPDEYAGEYNPSHQSRPNHQESY